jgi:hypothetical protein
MTDRPRLAWPEHYAYLAAATVHLLRLREQGYPALITAHKLPAATAAAKLEQSRCLVAQWRWATDPAQPALPLWGDTGRFGAWARELRDELADTGRTTRARADARADDADAAELADLVDALLWYQHDGPGGDMCRLTADILFYRDVNATLHRRARAGMLQAAA